MKDDTSTLAARAALAKPIIDHVAGQVGIAREALIGRKRGVLSTYRKITWYLLRKHTVLSLQDIGGLFDGRDHTTVLYGDQDITRAMIATDNPVQHMATQLEDSYLAKLTHSPHE